MPGPGVLNAGAALLTAFGCNEPVLCLTGQVPTAFLGKGRGHLHEMPDQIATLRTFVKWADRIEYPDIAPAMVSRAFQEMMSGRRGPVSLEMPWDVFTQRAEVGPSKVFDTLPAPQPDPDRIKAAADLIKASKRPMIFVGSGAIHAREEILELAEMIDAPVVAFRSGRGIVSNAHELGLTMAAAYRLWPTTDLMIGIGTRLELPTMSRWPYRPDGLKCIRIDIDPVEMRRYVPDTAVIADAKAGTADLVAAVKKAGYSKSSGRRGEIREATAAAQQEIQKVQPQMAYLNILREVLPANAIVTDELSQVGFASWYGFPIYEPRTFITSGYQGTLGSGFPTALGAKVANPDRPVVAITGDGGFMFAVQELATAVQFKIGVVTLVFNNNAYGNVRRDQRERFDGRVVASDLVNPDFVKLAESFGVGAARVTSPDHFRPALEKALADGGPYVISVEVPTDSEVSPWAFIHPAKPKLSSFRGRFFSAVLGTQSARGPSRCGFCDNGAAGMTAFLNLPRHTSLHPRGRNHQQTRAGDRPARHRRPVQQRRVFRQFLQAAGDRRHPRKGRERQRGEHQPDDLALGAGLPDRQRGRDGRHQHAAPRRTGDELRRDQYVEVTGILRAENGQRPEQPGGAHHDQPAAVLDHDAGREHRDVEADPEHRHQPWQFVRLGEAQEERRAVDGKMQLIAERQDDHRGDEEHRYLAERFCRRAGAFATGGPAPDCARPSRAPAW